MRKALTRLLIVALSFLSVSAALATVPEWAVRYWFLYYSPVIIAALSFGLRGALVASLAAELSILSFFLRLGELVSRAVDLRERLAFMGLPWDEVEPALAVLMGTPALKVLERLSWSPLDLPRELTGAIVGMAIITAASCLIGWLVDENKRKEAQVLYYAYTDGLTGISNYRRFRERLDEETKRTQRYGHPFALLLIDMDNLKDYNDSYGHLSGDCALKAVAGVLASNVRNVDLVARYGGDEFAVIMLEASRETAIALAERLRERVADYVPPTGGEKGSVTISIGGTLLGPQNATSGDDVLSSADQALYQAKTAGGNRALFAVSPSSPINETTELDNPHPVS